MVNASVETRPPRPESGRELKAVLDAERAGHPFLLYRDAAGGQQLVVLDDPARSVTLGRGAQTDLTLDWDQEVSAVHAELHCAGGQWTLADDGLSSNGTYLNGNRISGRLRLRDGDQVRLGRTVLVYRSSTAEPTPGTLIAGDLPTVERLSDTQRRVLIALCRPYREGGSFATAATNQQIAEEVFLSVHTVKTHLRALFAKFGLDELPQNQKRVRLAECAVQSGLVSQRDP
jgi:pSer/pThr/pTyr-binding forkhead associated (FHA) protein